MYGNNTPTSSNQNMTTDTSNFSNHHPAVLGLIKVYEEALSGDTKMKTHLEGMVNRVERGSFIEGIDNIEKTIGFLKDVLPTAVTYNANEINEQWPGCGMDGCTYYKAIIPEGVKAYIGITRIADISTQNLTEVKIRRSQHDITLADKTTAAAPEFLYGASVEYTEKEYDSTNEMWAIVGPHGNYGDVLYTWYPGPLTTVYRDIRDIKFDSSNGPITLGYLLDNLDYGQVVEGLTVTFHEGHYYLNYNESSIAAPLLPGVAAKTNWKHYTSR